MTSSRSSGSPRTTTPGGDRYPGTLSVASNTTIPPVIAANVSRAPRPRARHPDRTATATATADCAASVTTRSRSSAKYAPIGAARIAAPLPHDPLPPDASRAAALHGSPPTRGEPVLVDRLLRGQHTDDRHGHRGVIDPQPRERIRQHSLPNSISPNASPTERPIRQSRARVIGSSFTRVVGAQRVPAGAPRVRFIRCVRRGGTCEVTSRQIGNLHRKYQNAEGHLRRDLSANR